MAVAQAKASERPLEIGERVRFRSLQWEVEDVSAGAIRLFGREASNQGRRLSVIPGFEPVERVKPPPLTYRIGERDWSDADWRAMHDAYRLTLAQGRGSVGTAAWGRLILEPYQLVPLKRIEQLPEPRLLIADDMGLGKTSEAGLILSRLTQKRRADRILVVTRARPEPERWRDELQEKFGLDFQVLNDGTDYRRLRQQVPSHLNLYAAIPRLIASMHFLAQADRLPDLDRSGIRWDVVVVDEAHHLALRGSSEKRLYELAQVLARRSDALLLLTATPHDGKVESFASLVEMVDEYAVPDRGELRARLVRPLMVRRLKSQVIRAGGERFIEPELAVVVVEPERSAAERYLERGIRGYTAQLRKQQRRLEASGERGRASGLGFLESLLRKRLASSVRACRETLEQRLSGGSTSRSESEDEPTLTDLSDLEQSLPNGKTEREVLEDLLRRANRIPDGRDGKMQVLARLVGDLVARREKVVVFTEYRATLRSILDLFARHGLEEGVQVLSYHGDTGHRDEVRRRFLEDPEALVLLATDAASEGINLQETCHNLIHVEVPWNPNRYAQRNGRIDRYGQSRTARIVMLVARGYVEERAAELVIQKIAQIGRDLGSVSNVAPFASAVSLEEYLAENAGDEEEVDVEAVASGAKHLVDDAVRVGSPVPRELTDGESFGQQDLDQLQGELASVEQFAPTFEDVRVFLHRLLTQEGGQLEPAADPEVFRVQLSAPLKSATGIDSIPRATFRRDLAIKEASRPRAERVAFLSPGHPVVAAGLRRARGWALSPGFASRVSYRVTPTRTFAGILFTYAVRFLDGRGETVEERFEVVPVDAAGRTSGDADSALRLFMGTADAAPLGSMERETVERRARTAFERLREAADEECATRSAGRCIELAREQRRIADEALLRLGEWRERALARIDERFPTQPQMILLPDAGERRRQTIFANRRRELEAKVRLRREQVSALRDMRVDSIDPIGALVLVPRGGWPDD
ncbi:MAG: hypothetical protein DLM67_12200 [Candidatus Nephthysia bennettiae]|nr:MAG: hypothetical protein DLM67_12200 [Candidatus Dormibacteraeota bacterium]